MTTICLNMIVKDEAAIIADTLANILAHIPIDYWVIADTGSSDDTMAIIQSFFQQHDIAGELLQHPWQNFGHNRQLALNAAQGKSDYVFFFDADDRFEGDFALPPTMEATFYNLYLTNMSRSTRYPRRLLAKNDGSVFWMGVLHEVIMPHDNAAAQEAFIEGAYCVVSGRFGARNQDPEKYLKDAQTLEQAFHVETNTALKRRYAYYCAQSYRDCHNPALAAEWLERNLALCQPQTGEEARFSFIALGTEYRKLGDPARTLQAWWDAHNALPDNAEALGLLAEYYFQLGRYQLGYDAAKKAVTLPPPNPRTTLFVNEPVHRFVIWYELARHAIKLAHWEDAYRACKHLLHQPEHSAALNSFVLNVLDALKIQIENDSFKEVVTMHQRLQQLQHLDEDAWHKRQNLLAWFAQHGLS